MVEVAYWWWLLVPLNVLFVFVIGFCDRVLGFGGGWCC